MFNCTWKCKKKEKRKKEEEVVEEVDEEEEEEQKEEESKFLNGTTDNNVQIFGLDAFKYRQAIKKQGQWKQSKG